MKKVALAAVVSAVAVAVAALSFGAGPTRASSVPAGFEDRPVTDVQQPTSMAFLPDGRMLVTTQPGILQAYDPATGSKRGVLDLQSKTCANSEQGLLGIAVDPDFESNRFIYLYYTFKKFGVCPEMQPGNPNNPVNRVARYKLPEAGDATMDKILVDNIPSPNGNHNGGDPHFGKDGLLYVSVGDGGRDYKFPHDRAGANDASRDRHVLLGKILRVTRDGGIPADNPYANASNGARCGLPAANGRTAPGNVCKETFATGLRNPFRMAFDPDASTTRFNINDVGQNAWEEIDAGRKGADYAWNLCEGRHDNPDRAGSVACGAAPFTPPIHDYSHGSGCSSVTGGAFVPNAGPWPGAYDDSYLFGDYVCGKIFRLTPKADGGYAKEAFAVGLGQGGPVAMTFGPSGRDLYYTTYAGENPGGEIRRITYTSGNVAPEARAAANPPHAESPGDLTIDFDTTGSRDPDGDPLAYEWDFDYDGQSFQADATGPAPSHAYAAAGKKTAALRATDDKGLSDTATVEVYPGDTPPGPVIENPAEGERFRVGQQITLQGSATDAEGAGAPALTWEVRRWHSGQHFHPYKSGTGETLTITGPEPEDLLATNPEGNYLEIRLTAKEPDGLTQTVTRKLQPRTTGVTLASNPTGLRLAVNGRGFVAPKTFLSWEGDGLNVSAPTQQKDGQAYVFRSWSDGRAAQHTIVTPTDYKKYTATFRRR